jgi:predicted ATPase
MADVIGPDEQIYLLNKVASVAAYLGRQGIEAKLLLERTGIPISALRDARARVSQRQRIARPAGSEQFPDGSVTPRYEFLHALYRETLYRRLTARRRAKLHRRIGDRLEALFSHLSARTAEALGADDCRGHGLQNQTACDGFDKVIGAAHIDAAW